MRQAFWIFLAVATCPAWAAKWSKEIPADSALTRERRQFSSGDWIPLSQPCLTCRPLTDPADTGRRIEEIGLTPPRPPTVTRQIHKTNFFPQDESAILSVPPPPVFNQNQNGNLQSQRFPSFIQQFNNPNTVQFETQPVFQQAQFLPQPFLGSTSLLGSNYPQVLPLLNNPSALLVQGGIATGQEIKTQKINQDAKIHNLQENVILEQNRQIKNQQIHGLEVPLNAALPFHRQQIDTSILTPPPAPNNSVPDVIIPGLGKEEIQLLYVPLETLKQRSQQNQQEQRLQQVQQQHHQQEPQLRQRVPQNVKISQQSSPKPTELPSTSSSPAGHFITHPATPITATASTTFLQHPVTPSTLFFQHLPFHETQSPFITSTPQSPTLQTFITPSSQKFSPFPTVTPTENIITIPENIHFSQGFPTTPKSIVNEFGKAISFEELQKLNKFKSISIQNQEQQQKQIQLQQQKEEEKHKLFLEQQERERLQQKLYLEQQEKERQQKLIKEQEERERQEKIVREQQERERQDKIIREQKERERQQKLFLEQQERERQQKYLKEQQELQQKLLREQQERERKLLREKQERERQEKLLLEQQERERQEKLIREKQERERQQKLLLEQQERERQEKLIREQQEREHKQKLLLEQQERERQEKLIREQHERELHQKLIQEQQERERQQKILEQQERERQQKILEQQERERQQKILEQQERERQQKILEQQERELQEKLLLEQQQRALQEKLIKEQQEQEQQKLLFEQQERERQEQELVKQEQEREQQRLLQELQDRERQLLLRQQQEFLLQQQHVTQPVPTQFELQQPTPTPPFEVETETPENPLEPHQPPLSVFYGSSKGQPVVTDVLKELRGAKTISVLDQHLENLPKVFVGPASMRPPKGYGKFDLPYLSNLDINRVERKVDRFPFFVAPLNFIPPDGYSKIPFPAPHVGSVVVSSEAALRQAAKVTTKSPYFSSIRTTPQLIISTQPPPTTFIHPKLKQSRVPVTEEIITTTSLPETTTQVRSRRPYRPKARRPVTAVQPTRRPEEVQKFEVTQERRPGLKYPKRTRQRVKTTTETADVDSLNSANGQYLVETNLPGNQEPQQEIITEAHGLFDIGKAEVSSEAPIIQGPSSTKDELVVTVNNPPQETFLVTTHRPQHGLFESTSRAPSAIDHGQFGQTDYFVTTQRVPAAVEIENAGNTGFYQQPTQIPVGVQGNGNSGYYNQQGLSEAVLYTTGYGNYGNYENVYYQQTPQPIENYHEVKAQPEEEVRTTGTYFETSTEPSTALPKKNENIEHDIRVHQSDEYAVTGEGPITTQTPSIAKVKSRVRSKSRGQINYASSQTTTPSSYVRKRVVYKTRKEEPAVNGTEEVRHDAVKYRGLKKQSSGEVVYDGLRTGYSPKPLRRATVLRRRKPITHTTETTSQVYYDGDYSPSGVSNDVFDDQIRESSQARRQYSENSITSTTETTSVASSTELYTRRKDEILEDATVKMTAEEHGTEHYGPATYYLDVSTTQPTSATGFFGLKEVDDGEDFESKKYLEVKKAVDPVLEKKSGRRRIRVRVHKRPHEQFEAAESQNIGSLTNSLSKPSAEPDLYRFAKTGFDFDKSEKFAGTYHGGRARNITSQILENTATFSAPGVEVETDPRRVTIAGDTTSTSTTTTTTSPTTTTEETTPEPTAKQEEDLPAVTTVDYTETTTFFESTTAEPETEAPTTVDEEVSREIQLSTATEISHETEICFRGRCIKTNSATADDDLRKLVQSEDKVLKT